MLSLGGDAAVARGTVGCAIPDTDVLVMGTRKQIGRLAEKLSIQPFGLRELGAAIREFLENIDQDAFVLKTPRRQILSVHGHGSWAFSMLPPIPFPMAGNIYPSKKLWPGGVQMVEEGADIIDVGGESTRPGANPVSLDEEMSRVIPVIEKLSPKWMYRYPWIRPKRMLQEPQSPQALKSSMI